MVSPAQSRLIDAGLQPAAVGQQISVAIASKVLNSARQEGAAVLSMLDAAGQVADPQLAQASGLGTQLDVTA
jgi:hypothetical protein